MINVIKLFKDIFFVLIFFVLVILNMSCEEKFKKNNEVEEEVANSVSFSIELQGNQNKVNKITGNATISKDGVFRTTVPITVYEETKTITIKVNSLPAGFTKIQRLTLNDSNKYDPDFISASIDNEGSNIRLFLYDIQKLVDLRTQKNITLFSSNSEHKFIIDLRNQPSLQYNFIKDQSLIELLSSSYKTVFVENSNYVNLVFIEILNTNEESVRLKMNTKSEEQKVRFFTTERLITQDNICNYNDNLVQNKLEIESNFLILPLNNDFAKFVSINENSILDRKSWFIIKPFEKVYFGVYVDNKIDVDSLKGLLDLKYRPSLVEVSTSCNTKCDRPARRAPYPWTLFGYPVIKEVKKGIIATKTLISLAKTFQFQFENENKNLNPVYLEVDELLQENIIDPIQEINSKYKGKWHVLEHQNNDCKKKNPKPPRDACNSIECI